MASDSVLLFLDIDGVLNSRRWFVENYEYIRTRKTLSDRSKSQIDPAQVALLNDLCDLNVEVVVSSSHRKSSSVDELSSMLQELGLKLPVIGKTPTVISGCREVYRGLEIHTWLEAENRHTSNFIILDDSSDMGPLAYRHIRTEMEFGLNEEHIKEIRELINIWRPRNGCVRQQK